ncbi:MAG TPA: DNA polymerase III subunit delta' [Acetobacteraceae bacterium]|jgi:DNA polymerase-3 subunit delta'|nr:DNA polymerase III subunit delta' [Acetobacteraceae bacterium]
MTAPAPRANPRLEGHAAAEALLAEGMRTGRLHHAWLLTGPPGIGKATLAYRFARRLFAGVPEGNSLALPAGHPVFRRVATGSHADLLTIEREWDPKRKKLRSEIVVDDVRRIAGFLHRTAAEGGWRVVVVDGAETLNSNAENALLKVLEEPPPRAMLLLACSAAGRLLPTIRSRCRRLPLSPLPEETVAALLADYLPEANAATRARLAALADGSPGRALRLAETGGGAAALVDQVMAELPRIDVLRAHAVADALGREDEPFATFMELLSAGLATAVRDAGRGRADPDQLRLLGGRPLDAWVHVWHALVRLQDETEGAYLDKRQAIVTGLLMLSQDD